MTSLRIVQIFLSFICFSLFAENNTSSFDRNVAKWIEVPDSIYQEIVTNPWFSNSCHWEVSLSGGIIVADSFEIISSFPLSNPSRNIPILFPGAVIDVPDGWLVAYHKEVSLPDKPVRKVFWYSDDKSKKRFLCDAWITQFCSVGDEIFAGCRSGILKFTNDKKDTEWSSEKVLEFDFDRVYGITPNPNEGFLILAQTGWWSVAKDYTVTSLPVFETAPISGSSIAKKGKFVFVGGGFFVSKINLDNRTVRRLCPSKEFLDAMRSFKREQFYNYLKQYQNLNKYNKAG